MLPHRMTVIALGCAIALSAAPALALSQREAARPADLPPAGYKPTSWVDSRGCTYFRSQADTWVPALDASGRTVCGTKVVRGAVSPLTGYPVPPGYRVAWQDGRLNPLRGLPDR